jgi:uncharacterized membrane protein YedE/YeeE
MLEWMQMEMWSPYVVGIAIGVLSWFTFLLSGNPLSCSTAISQTSGMVEKLFKGKQVEEKEYYKKFPPEVNWRWMLLFGVFIGAAISAAMSGNFDLRWVPPLWEHAFGSAALPRLVVAFVGGVLMGFGSRWANGCTSGHGISGTLQLAVSSWISVIFFFIGGIACAMFIFYVVG